MSQYGADSIQTKENLEAIRFRPEMYIGARDIDGQIQVLREVIDNSIDEVRAVPEKMHHINITVFFNKEHDQYQIIISDTGRGIPIGTDSFRRAVTVLHSSGKYGGGAYTASGGTFGVGLKTTAALGRNTVVITEREKRKGLLYLKEGLVVREEYEKKKQFSTTGTVLFYELDPVYFHSGIQFETEGIEKLIDLFRFINVFVHNVQINLYISDMQLNTNIFNTASIDEIHTLLTDQQAIINQYKAKLIYVNDTVQDPMNYLKQQFNVHSEIPWSIDNLNKEFGTEGIDARLAYQIKLFATKNPAPVNSVINTVNMIRIKDITSYHVTGLNDELKHILTAYVDFEKDNDKVRYFKDNYKLPIYSAIMVKFDGAVFVGQTKDAFKDDEFLVYYKKVLYKQLLTYSEDSWRMLAKLIQEDFDIKYKKFKNRGVIVNNAKDIIFNLHKAKHFAPCTTNDNSIAELYLLEGTSALGQAKQARNSDFQAIFAFRGKPINTMTKNRTVYEKDLIYQDLRTILGISSDETDMSKCNYCRIFIMTDPDIHGYHIANLMYQILYSINPRLITSGMVCISNPPLYRVVIKKHDLYFRDRQALIEKRIDTVYFPNIELKMCMLNSGVKIVLENENYTFMINLIIHIGELLNRIAVRTLVDVNTLEKFINMYDAIVASDFETLKTGLGADRLRLDKENNTIIVSFGIQDKVIPLNSLIKEIKTFIIPEYDHFKIHDIYFELSTKNSDFYKEVPMLFSDVYAILQQFDGMTKAMRFKGLGEMSDSVLAVTCMNPVTRAFVTITSPGDFDTIYKMLGDDSNNRKELVLNKIVYNSANK